MEVLAGVVDEEAEGVTADGGVKVTGILVTSCCLQADCVWIGDGRHCLAEPWANVGEEYVAEGAILFDTTGWATERMPAVSWSGL